jgi:hypothetical protein
MGDEEYEIEAREVLQNIFSWRDDQRLYIHISLHNSFAGLNQLKSMQRGCLLLAYSMELRPMWLTNPYYNLL